MNFKARDFTSLGLSYISNHLNREKGLQKFTNMRLYLCTMFLNFVVNVTKYLDALLQDQYKTLLVSMIIG